ncbi:MAG TPA: 3-hydroxylacyl-ACP dehydratase [Usitatibacter sp.]|nr:3-hydroxylacyl-ACP dehydratase [Usitatibacter sp.]
MSHDRAWIESHLPHKGAMCLLDEIIEWDESRVRALARRHRSPDHPLRSRGALPAVCAIEYGAQAAAAHGALCSSQPSGAGFLAGVRGVTLNARRLDDIASDLRIDAEQLGASAAGVLYSFTVTGDGRVLVAGRLTVAFER